MKKIFITVLVCTALLFAACTKSSSSSGSLYVPTAADATANATLSELQQGRTLYINNCGACHGLSNPDDYSKAGWTSILNSMVNKTSLTAAQETLVYKYVTRGL